VSEEKDKALEGKGVEKKREKGSENPAF